MSLKIINLRLQPHFLGANELNYIISVVNSITTDTHIAVEIQYSLVHLKNAQIRQCIARPHCAEIQNYPSDGFC